MDITSSSSSPKKYSKAKARRSPATHLQDHTLEANPRTKSGQSSSFSSPVPPYHEYPSSPTPLCTLPMYRLLKENDDTNRDVDYVDASLESQIFTTTSPLSSSTIGSPLGMSPPPPPPYSPPDEQVDAGLSGALKSGAKTPECDGNGGDDEIKDMSTIAVTESSIIAYMRGSAREREIMATGLMREVSVNNPRFYIGDIERYSIIAKVGSGTYSEVFKCQHKVTKDIVALKKLRPDVDKNGISVTSIREMKILKHLKHPNILDLKEIVSSNAPPNEGERPHLYFAFEYLEHDLSGLLNHPRVKFTRTQIQCYMRQLLTGVAFMHRKNIIHRDLKTSNLLLNNQGMLKVGDFGLSRFWNAMDAKAGRYTNEVVTLWYRSPELLMGSTSYDFSVDIWSIGCIFGELLLGKPILQGKTEIEQLQMIFGFLGMPTEETWPGFFELPSARSFQTDDKCFWPLFERFQNSPPQAVDLLKKLLQLDPTKRITAEEAMDHDYFWRIPTCKPRDLPKLAVSSAHEYQSMKRHHDEMIAHSSNQHHKAHQRGERSGYHEWDESYHRGSYYHN